MKYSEIRKSLKTGDIVLFSGKGGISTGIKWLTTSKFSHVGMVLNISAYNFITLWESTTLSNVKDLDTGKLTKGVQVVPLSARLAVYNGEIAIRHLEAVNITDSATADLMEFRHEIRGKPYEEDKLELLKAAYDGPLGRNIEDLSSLFCSELVAEAYQRLGLLSEEKPSNEYTPADFSEKEELALLKGALGREITVTYDG